MTFQQILEGITRHRANRINLSLFPPSLGPEGRAEIQRKLDEIEWALQALAEACRDKEEE